MKLHRPEDDISQANLHLKQFIRDVNSEVLMRSCFEGTIMFKTSYNVVKWQCDTVTKSMPYLSTLSLSNT